MRDRDNKGNTEEEIHDAFFDWLDNQITLPQLFEELPELKYSDLVAFCQQKYGNEYYGDIVFDLWAEKVYNK